MKMIELTFRENDETVVNTIGNKIKGYTVSCYTNTQYMNQLCLTVEKKLVKKMNFTDPEIRFSFNHGRIKAWWYSDTPNYYENMRVAEKMQQRLNEAYKLYLLFRMFQEIEGDT